MENLLRLLGYLHVPSHGVYRERWDLGDYLSVYREDGAFAMYLDYEADTPDGTHVVPVLLYRGNDRDVFTVLSEFHAPDDYTSPY